MKLNKKKSENLSTIRVLPDISKDKRQQNMIIFTAIEIIYKKQLTLKKHNEVKKNR